MLLNNTEQEVLNSICDILIPHTCINTTKKYAEEGCKTMIGLLEHNINAMSNDTHIQVHLEFIDYLYRTTIK